MKTQRVLPVLISLVLLGCSFGFSKEAVLNTMDDTSVPVFPESMVMYPYAAPSTGPGMSKAPIPTRIVKPMSLSSKAMQSVIHRLEDMMRGTCSEKMEASISMNGEGEIGIGSLGMEGSLKITILNPDVAKECRKK